MLFFCDVKTAGSSKVGYNFVLRLNAKANFRQGEIAYKVNGKKWLDTKAFQIVNVSTCVRNLWRTEQKHTGTVDVSVAS